MKKILAIIAGLGLLSLIAFLALPKFQTKNVVVENGQTEQNTKKESAPNPDSIPAMSQKEFTGSDLKLEKVIGKNEFYTKYFATYKSEELEISGVMNVPAGKGPFPIIILNHGYIDPKVYRSGTGVSRELDFFARHGYVVFQSDYRGHAASDPDPANDVRPRSGYVEDVLNGINALKNSDLAFLDTNNIGMLGHSMGGGVTLNIMVTKPDIAKAYALLAPINSDYKTNFDTWVKTEWPEVAQNFYDTYGTYEEKPEVWESFSAKNYLEKVTAPVMLHQGTSDDQVPVQWSRNLEKMLKEKNKDITYFEYPNENHVMRTNAQNLAMQRTLEFFDKNLWP